MELDLRGEFDGLMDELGDRYLYSGIESELHDKGRNLVTLARRLCLGSREMLKVWDCAIRDQYIGPNPEIEPDVQALLERCRQLWNHPGWGLDSWSTCKRTPDEYRAEIARLQTQNELLDLVALGARGVALEARAVLQAGDVEQLPLESCDSAQGDIIREALELLEQGHVGQAMAVLRGAP